MDFLLIAVTLDMDIAILRVQPLSFGRLVAWGHLADHVGSETKSFVMSGTSFSKLFSSRWFESYVLSGLFTGHLFASFLLDFLTFSVLKTKFLYG